ncbi:MAG: alpha-L-fucosidase [Clostridia bacterium]|jgi:alpha-L-fucosidase
MIKKFNDQRDRFFQHRFGMFVHWGIYAIPAWHEQILWRRNMSPFDYKHYAKQFNPVKFNPHEWIDLMQEAGMEYICFTTKHHDGFCMWDTKQTDYNIMNSAYGKDILKLLTDACHERGIKVGLYYSCVDWDHPYYPNLGRSHELSRPKPGDDPDINRYYNEYVIKQIEELCTNYGPISHFFWDLNIAEYKDPSVNDLIRKLQPGIMINDRGPGEGDYKTPERSVPPGRRFELPTEACQSVGKHSWGYKQDEDYYSVAYLINSIDKIMAMGGNYLLNVGPDASGVIPEEAQRIIRSIGRWYKKVREAFDDAVPAFDMITDNNVMLTRKHHTLYAHVNIPVISSGIVLTPIDVLPNKAVLLNTGQELETRVDITPYLYKEKPILRIRGIPADDLTGEVPVIKLEFDEAIEKYVPPEKDA